jgi:hypothetical protein
VTHSITNTHNFEISHDKIVIPGNGSIDIEIRYIPSDLENTETGNITFETSEIGSWNFMVFGIGIPPTRFPVKYLSGSLNKDCSGAVNFKNPFRETIAVSMTLEADEKSKQVFDLLMKKQKLQIAPQGVLQIPFSFLPRDISDYKAEIIVMMNEKINWRYPIVGITEASSSTIDYNFKTTCRQSVEKEITFSLQGVTDIEDGEQFHHELNVFSKEFEYSLKKWFILKPIQNTLINPADQ